MAKKMAVSNGQANVYRTWVLSYNTSPLGAENQQPKDSTADTDAKGTASATAQKSKTWTSARSKGRGRSNSTAVLPANYQRIEPGESVLQLEHQGRRVHVLGLPAGAGTLDRSKEDVAENVAVELVFHEDPDAPPSVVQTQAQDDKRWQQQQQQQQQHKSTPLMERLKRLSPRITRKQVGQIRKRYFPGPSRAGRR